MRIGRTIIIPAILALGAAGSIAAGAAMAAPAAHAPAIHVQAATSSGGTDMFYHL
jgi:hypothetical protein